jgi:hypothetical protein
MGLAFELAFVALRLADRGDLANAVLAVDGKNVLMQIFPC